MMNMDIEAWLDVGEMREAVSEHARLISMMNQIMNESRRAVHFTSAVTMRDIGDASVLRRMRLIQMAALTNSDKVKMVFTRHGRMYRERMTGT